MARKKVWWTIPVVVGAPMLGMAAGRLHLVQPSPGMFFFLGAMAALALVGIVHGVRAGLRAARTGSPIEN